MVVNGQAVVRRERRNDMELYEIVMKLVGPVQPVGETRADEQRLTSMKKLTELAEKAIGIHARDFMAIVKDA